MSAPTDQSQLDGLIDKLKSLQDRLEAEGAKMLALDKAADLEDIEKYVDEQIKAEEALEEEEQKESEKRDNFGGYGRGRGRGRGGRGGRGGRFDDDEDDGGRRNLKKGQPRHEFDGRSSDEEDAPVVKV